MLQDLKGSDIEEGLRYPTTLTSDQSDLCHITCYTFLTLSLVLKIRIGPKDEQDRGYRLRDGT